MTEWQPGDPLYRDDEALYVCPQCGIDFLTELRVAVSQCPTCHYWAQEGDAIRTYGLYLDQHPETRPDDAVSSDRSPG